MGNTSTTVMEIKKPVDTTESKKSKDKDQACGRTNVCCAVAKAVFIRLLLLTHSALAVWRVQSLHQNNFFWLLLLPHLGTIAETIFRLKVKKGQEWKWFCPCFLFYLCATLPAIWILELDKLTNFSLINQNITEPFQSINGLEIPIKLEPNVWVSVIEQSLLFLMILGRWVLPRGELTRDQLSQLLFVYIGMGSDIMELFVLFDEPQVRMDTTLTYAILVIWTISTLQFTLVLTATVNPKKGRTALVHPENSRGSGEVCGICLKTELWSLMVSIFMQDGPFLTVRLYALISYNLMTYSIIFFTCKNILVLMLLLYRLMVLCIDHHSNDDDDDDEEEDDAKDVDPTLTGSDRELTPKRPKLNPETKDPVFTSQAEIMLGKPPGVVNLEVSLPKEDAW